MHFITIWLLLFINKQLPPGTPLVRFGYEMVYIKWGIWHWVSNNKSHIQKKQMEQMFY